jgi:plasmid stabilization system protein ParE
MSYTVLMLDDAEQDLLGIHAYIQNRFSAALANEIYDAMREAILMLEDNPYLGTVIPQLAKLSMSNYRHMVVMQKNRVVYELDQKNELIYVYLICNERQDYDTVLRQRLLHF